MTLFALAFPICWFCVGIDPRFLKRIHERAHGASDSQIPFVVPMPHDLSRVRDRRLPS